MEQIDGLNIKQAQKFLALRDKTNPDKAVEFVQSRGVKFLTFDDENYPALLKQIETPPAVLYYKGSWEGVNLDRTLAVVGSRRASTSARAQLAKIIAELGNTDICVVSGLASGIDTAAHESALANNLKTIGVIASGFDFTYPAANRQLYERIINGGGVVVTEFFPTFEPLPFRFLQRNRIVSGLSSGTFVVEASLKSGALTTANLTLEQGRELMCMPGLISNPNTAGIYKMLKTGAALVTCADDILEALKWEIKTEQLPLLSPEDDPILNAIEIEPLTADEILAQTNLKLEDLLTDLTVMELKGIIEKIDGDRYRKR